MKLLTTCLVLSASAALSTAAGLYTGKSAVLNIDAKNYDSLIAQSNHTSILEFYAPWCGHCQNLKPAYEKAAKQLQGLAKVAAVNCDEDANKAFCGQFGVQGFPTLKIIKPGKKAGKPSVEDYRGPREAPGIVEAVKDKISNHVKRLKGAEVDRWIKQGTQAKAILFTEKGTTAALFKALAIDFLGNIEFAQVRSKEVDVVKQYNIVSFPSIKLISNGEEHEYSDTDMSKQKLTAFFSQIVSPNPDPAPKPAKASTSKTTKAKASKSASSKFSKASEKEKSSKMDDFLEHAGTIVLDDDMPNETTMPKITEDEPKQKPMKVADAVPAPLLPTLTTRDELVGKCLLPKSGHCVLILEDQAGGTAQQAKDSLASISHKFNQRNAPIFPMYVVPTTNSAQVDLRLDMDLQPGTQVFVVNSKRGWIVPYSGFDFNQQKLETWINDVRNGDGVKRKLPPAFKKETGAASTAEAAEPVPVDTAEVTAEEEVESTTAAKSVEEPTPVDEATSVTPTIAATSTVEGKESESIVHGEL